jgi:hypothetical protein
MATANGAPEPQEPTPLIQFNICKWWASLKGYQKAGYLVLSGVLLMLATLMTSELTPSAKVFIIGVFLIGLGITRYARYDITGE